MTANPIAGQFSAVINNEGNIFHPNHPSPYAGYFQAGRYIKIYIGGIYATGGPKRWKRIAGIIDEPDFASDTYELAIKGLDLMKFLSDMKFTKEFSAYPFTPIDNFWGTLLTTDSQATTTWGPELYVGADAANPTPPPGGEVNGIGLWVVHSGAPLTQVNSQGQIGGWSFWELEFVADPPLPPPDPLPFSLASLRYPDAFNAAAGQEYYVTFKYTRTAGVQGDARLNVGMIAGVELQGSSWPLDPPTNNVWHTGSFSFTYAAGGLITIAIYTGVRATPATWRIDNISIMAVLGNVIKYYDMNALSGGTCTGIYHVELDGEPEWPGKQKGEGWYYDIATNRFWFDEDKVVATGGNNLDIYYYTAQKAEEVVADILAKAGLYANRAAALAAMGPPVTTVSMNRVWFNAGSTYINAIKKLCERCNYRFYFNWNGVPVFVTAPVAGPPVFTTFLPQHIRSPRLYQDKNEIRNRIVIEGEKIAELVGWEENMPSELKGEAFDAGSIATYGEHTLNIRNHLFQDQASIYDSGTGTGMCATLLAAYKDPKWYLDFETPYNAVPLVLGDTIRVQELLDIAGPITVTHTCLIRNADVSQFNVTYKCQI